jgi:CxxC-x17-CxxC domain-containing protein
MNNFKKPYGSRPGVRPGTRPGARPKFGAGASSASSSSSSSRPRPYQSRPLSRTGSSRFDAVQKFDAVCSNCGKACQVPFRPDGKKPVYCKNCFDAPRTALPALKRSSSANTADATATANGGGGAKTITDLTRQIAAMNAKIDTMLKILEEGA